MKILLCVHGYPPELVGGTELSTKRLAAALVRAGHEVVVFAGTLDWEKRGTLEETRDTDGVRVLRYSRDDLYFDHWHKGRSASVRSAFAAVLERERPDVVHVHHWIRLTRDLIATAARAGVPAVASLHDAWTSCLVAFRIRPATRLPCDAPLAVDPCIDCARVLEPPTPWMDADEEQRRFEEHRADLVRELELARAVVVPTLSHARTIEAGLGLAPGALRTDVVRPAVDLPERARAVPRFESGDVLRIGSWGHYAEHKGLEVLIDAVRALPDPTRVELRLAGGTVLPAHRARLEERARGLPVRFDEGYAPHELGALPVTDVHLFASGSLARESWGLVVDEALALGLPVVLPRAGAFAERAQGVEWARLYEQTRAEDLARVLRELLENPPALARMSAAVPDRAALFFDGDAQAAALASVYERARAAGPPPVPSAPDDARDLADQRSWDDRLQGR
ncbi:Glycogen synthase [Planctomycetes bacterium Pla163]|uniref:Glycogen synthase n=1 Tax=Rohdeia mirabilis TaxID=2528008 RepID=A0A518CYP7_9BACT|nr:Glycogen synthase [Planctomycetes bacterium Pla163]